MAADYEDDPEFNAAAPKPSPRRRSWVIEGFAVLGILVLLIALLLPASRSSRGSARRLHCTSNLRQIAQALHNYEQEYKSLPPAYTVDANGRPLHGWRTLILPYLDQGELYRTIDLAKPWNDPANARAMETAIPLYHCPGSVGPPNTTTYLAIVGPNGCFKPVEGRRLAEITDGHDLTLMVIDAGEENAVPWMAPVDAGESLVMGLGPATKFHHAGGTNAAFVDGRVMFLMAAAPAPLRRAWLSISGGDDVVVRDRE